MAASTHQALEAKWDDIPSPMELFNAFCLGAEKKDIEIMKPALCHASINIQVGTLGSAAYQLALKHTFKTRQALDFLLENFPAERTRLLTEIIFAHAECGRRDEVNQILNENPKQQSTFLPHVVNGYARYGYVEEINQILISAKKSNLLLRKMSIYGYAAGGHRKKAYNLLNSANNPAERIALLKFMINGFAYGGYETYANHVLKNNPAFRSVLLPFMMGGLAQAGRETLILNLIKENPNEKLDLLKAAFFAYATRGHVTHINHLLELEKDADIETKSYLWLDILLGYAVCGLMTFAKKEALLLPEEIWLNFMALHLAIGGHVFYVNQLIADHPEEKLELLGESARGFAIEGFGDEANQLQNFTDDPNEKMFIRKRMKLGFVEGDFLTAMEEIQESQEKPEKDKYLKKAVHWLTRNGHIIEAIQYLDLKFFDHLTDELLVTIAEDLKKEGIFSDPHAALFMLALFNPECYQKKLAAEVIKEEKEAEKLVSRAKELHPLLTTPSPVTEPNNFRYRLGTDWPLITVWFLQLGVGLVKENKINHAMLFLLSTYLFPITAKEAEYLSHHFFKPNTSGKNSLENKVDPVIQPPQIKPNSLSLNS